LKPVVDIKSALAAATPYGLTLNTSNGNFSGSAWGGDIVGWIGFGNPPCATGKCTVRSSSVDKAPAASNVSVQLPPDSWCADTPIYRVIWNYNDPDNDRQAASQVQFINAGNPADVIVLPQQNTNDTTYPYNDPLGFNTKGSYNQAGFLKTGATYQVQVRVSDGVLWSPWVTAATNVTTPGYYFPLVNFTFNPNPPITGFPEQFTDATTNRSQGAAPVSAWGWQFTNAFPVSSNQQNPSAIFNFMPSDVTLGVTDSANHSCQLTETIGTAGSTPILKRKIIQEQ
jgi:hypothetical protein